jgi:hypothetical protein
MGNLLEEGDEGFCAAAVYWSLTGKTRMPPVSSRYRDTGASFIPSGARAAHRLTRPPNHQGGAAGRSVTGKKHARARRRR